MLAASRSLDTLQAEKLIEQDEPLVNVQSWINSVATRPASGTIKTPTVNANGQ
jgi:hypothetical protein